MGEVYCARDTKLDRSVALKILPEEMSVDAERMRRFVREAKAASNRKMEPWVSLRELRLASGRSGIWMGLAPDDSTMVLHDLGIQDIYALEWHAP